MSELNELILIIILGVFVIWGLLWFLKSLFKMSSNRRVKMPILKMYDLDEELTRIWNIMKKFKRDATMLEEASDKTNSDAE